MDVHQLATPTPAESEARRRPTGSPLRRSDLAVSVLPALLTAAACAAVAMVVVSLIAGALTEGRPSSRNILVVAGATILLSTYASWLLQPTVSRLVTRKRSIDGDQAEHR